MPEKLFPLTDSKARELPCPAAGYTITWCPKTPGFGVRVTAAGGRSWVMERRINGKTTRRTLGRATGRGSIGVVAARRLLQETNVDLERGIDRMVTRVAERKAEREERRADELTLTAALQQYVNLKRRGKDGLPLKERTKADYLAMVAQGGATIAGKRLLDGELFTLADKPLAKISGDDMRAIYKTASARGARRGVYAMQVLRAVLNWHGVKPPDNPLGKEVAGRDRIVLAATKGAPNPIPAERLGAWWRAACDPARSPESARFCQLALLTGARGGELKSVCMRDVDLEGGRVVLRDTKNRSDHTLLLSDKSLEIVAQQFEVTATSGKPKRPGDALFTVASVRKTLMAINEVAGVDISGHDLRATFASIAEDLCSAYTLKRMLNHAEAGDVTGAHYIGKSDTQLRTGWQLVAEYVTSLASEALP
ncbi:MAG: integrase family protein [Rhodoferax sp.]|nr:integrase family protein [Rhodoferax sp.]